MRNSRVSRRAVAAVLMSLLATGATACGSSRTSASSSASTTSSAQTASGTSGKDIAFVCALPSLGAFYSPMETGAKDAAQALGDHVSYTGLTPTAVTNDSMHTLLTAA